MKKWYFILLFSICCFLPDRFVYSQEVIASGGGDFAGADISLSWTAGENVTETFLNDEVVLTQGFQQPYSFYLTQIISVQAGWSGISGYIDPLEKGLEEIFQQHVNQLVILASMEGIYYPQQGINTLVDWDYVSGYQVKAAQAFDLKLKGTKVSDPVLPLEQGWNLMPVLSDCDVSANDLFSGVGELIIIKEVAGSAIFWPEFGISTLNVLQPGSGYWVAVSDETEIIFPDCMKNRIHGATNELDAAVTPWGKIEKSAVSHTIAFPRGVLSSAQISTGDIIGVFTGDGICAGTSIVKDPQKAFAITVYADDITTKRKEGFDVFETFEFKLLNYQSGSEKLLDIVFDLSMPSFDRFEVNGLSAVESVSVINGTEGPSATMDMSIYPNPGKGIFYISADTWHAGAVINIYNSMQQLVKTLKLHGLSDGEIYRCNLGGLPDGIYLIRYSSPGNIDVTKKLIIQ